MEGVSNREVFPIESMDCRIIVMGLCRIVKMTLINPLMLKKEMSENGNSLHAALIITLYLMRLPFHSSSYARNQEIYIFSGCTFPRLPPFISPSKSYILKTPRKIVFAIPTYEVAFNYML